MPSWYLEWWQLHLPTRQVYSCFLFQNWADPALSLTFSIFHAYKNSPFSLNGKFTCALYSKYSSIHTFSKYSFDSQADGANPAGLPTSGPCFWWHQEVDVASHRLLPPLLQGVCVKPTMLHPGRGANNLQPLRLPFFRYWSSCNPVKKEIWGETEKKMEELQTRGVSRWERNERVASGQGTRMLEGGDSQIPWEKGIWEVWGRVLERPETLQGRMERHQEHSWREAGLSL